MGVKQPATAPKDASAGFITRLRALFEALPDAMVVADQAGTIVLVNTQTERLFGYEPDELPGRPVDILVPERLRHRHRGHRASYFMAPTVRSMGSVAGLPAARKDGHEFPVEISLSPLETGEGMLVICAIRDVTLQRAAQRVAEQANHLKDEFLATVSHEFRTPLNAVLGWTRLLESSQLPRERAEHALAAIGRSASALAHMVDDLLDTSRILEGTIRLALEPVDLATVAQAALDAVRSLAAARRVVLTFKSAPGPRTVSGDAGRLQQVIWNLLANAIKFTPEGGRVGLFIEPSAGHVDIRIVDTGEGISPDFLPHVFERFRQGAHATTERHSGLGLGLGIVRQLVERHGGTVHAASPGPGQGATFTVRLPVTADAAAGPRPGPAERRTEPATTSPAPRLPRLDGLEILVVDDQADERMLTSLVLTQAGASVKMVASAKEALHVLAVERPHVLVSDIDLPDEDGYTLIRHIRQYEAEHGGFLPAVALTGYARAEDCARTHAAGFQVHAPKPIEPAALTAAIAALTRNAGWSITKQA